MEISETAAGRTATSEENPPSADDMLHIDKDFIDTLPLIKYEGKIVLVTDEAAAKKAVKILAREKVLGFDTETRPSFRKGSSYMTSLVQLCGAKCAYLFRLDYCGGVPVLFPIFEDSKILKVGVAVKDDVRHLKVRAPFDDAGFIDASDYTRKAKIENTGLRALAAHFLGGKISKNAQVSNWAARELSEQQIVYAATDAWISRELFLKIQELGIAPKKFSGKSICEPAKRKTFTRLNPKRFDAAEILGTKNVSDSDAPEKKRRRRRGGRRKPPASANASE